MILPIHLKTYFIFLVGISGIFVISCEHETYSQGKRLYQAFCANCHMDNGEGLRGLYPPLAKSDYLTNNPSQIACIIRNGISGPITVNGIDFDQPMAGISALNEVEINNILNYINHAWGNDLGISNITKVRSALEKCE